MSKIHVQLDFTVPGVPFRFIAAAGLLLVMARELASENVQLTTYYPAPSGVYTQMVTTQNTYLARDQGYVDIGTTASGAAANGNYSLAIMPITAPPANVTSGNVGIGTTSPLRSLQVGAGALAAAGVTGTGAFVRQDNVLSDILEVYPQNLTQGVALGYDYIKEIGSNANNNLTMDSKGTGTLSLQANGGTGNVGINTNAPANKLQVVGPGGVSIDAAVNGRIQTGDAGNSGGVWLSNGGNIFVGQTAGGVPGGPGTNEIGLWTAGAGWGVQIPQRGYLYIDNAGTACGGGSSPMNDAVNGWVAVCPGEYATFNQGLYIEGESIQNIGNPYYPAIPLLTSSPLGNGIQTGTVSYLCCAK
jgi:hypothetical protein